MKREKQTVKWRNEMAMDKELLIAWLSALRSGKYVQGTGFLRSSDNCFCAVGVLADLLVKRGDAVWRHSPIFSCFNLVESQFSRNKFPPIEDGALGARLAYKAGLPRAVELAITEANDMEKQSFLELADFIEAMHSKGTL
jgi:hypothetical protein